MSLLAIILIVALVAVGAAVVLFNKSKKENKEEVPAIEKEKQKLQSLIRNEAGIDEIIGQLDKILEIEPENTDMINNKARCLYLKSKEDNDKDMFDKALLCYDKSLSLNPDNAQTLFAKAQVLTSSEHHIVQSIEYYDKAIERSPDFMDAWRIKAQTLGILGPEYFDEARECYDHIMNLFSFKGGVEILLHEKIELMLKNLSQTGKYLDETIEDLDRLDKMMPNNPEVSFNKALAYHYAGEEHLASAMQFYDKAIGIDPDQESAWTNKGALHLQMKQLDEALACFDNAMQLNEESPMIWNNTALVYDKMGNVEKASACFEKVLSIDPDWKYPATNKKIVLETAWVNDPFKDIE